MDPLQTYSYLVKTREKLFDSIRPLTDDQYRREFPFAMKRLSATLPHMMMAEWAYAWRMERGTRADWSLGPIPRDAEPPFAEVEAAWRTQAERTRGVIETCMAQRTQPGGWDTVHESRTPLDGKIMVVRAAAADIFMQLYTHEVHHRAQLMAMLRIMGVEAQDLDYSFMMYIRWEGVTV